jgi:hypothetical protein
MSDQDDQQNKRQGGRERTDGASEAIDAGWGAGTGAEGRAAEDDTEADDEPQAFLSVRDLVQELERPTRSSAEFIVALCRSNAAHDRGVAALALCERLVAGTVTEQDLALLGLALRDELCAALEEAGAVSTQHVKAGAGASRRFKVPHPNGERLWVEVEARVDDAGAGQSADKGGAGRASEASVTFFWGGLIGAPVAQRPFFALTTQGLVVFEPYTPHRSRIPALLGGMLRELYT